MVTESSKCHIWPVDAKCSYRVVNVVEVLDILLDTAFIFQDPFIKIMLSDGLVHIVFYKMLFRVNCFVKQELVIFNTKKSDFFSPLVFIQGTLIDGVHNMEVKDFDDTRLDITFKPDINIVSTRMLTAEISVILLTCKEVKSTISILLDVAHEFGLKLI